MLTDNDIEVRVKAMAETLECFTVHDVMMLTGMSREPLVKLRNAGKGPPSVLVGRTLLYPVQAFREWLTANIGNPHPKNRNKRLEDEE